MAKQQEQKKPNAPVATNGTDAIIDRKFEFTPFLAKEAITLTPRTVIGWIAKPTKSGKRCTPEQALRFVMLCKARGLNPWEGDAYLVGYDTQDGPEFNLITAHQAFLKRAEVHPEYDGMESGVILRRGPEIVEDQGDFFLPDDILVGGWAKVFFKNRSKPVYRRLKLATFDKGFSRWKADPAGMIVKCAEADALRSAFPNSLGGMYLEAELGDPNSAPMIQQREPVRMPTAIDDRLPDAPPITIQIPERVEPEPIAQDEPGVEVDEFDVPLPPPMADWANAANPAR